MAKLMRRKPKIRNYGIEKAIWHCYNVDEIKYSFVITDGNMEAQMLLFYLRHGDPIYDPDSLTPLGHRQAEALGRRLARYGLDRIYASSSTRAQLTAKPTCEMLKLDMNILDWTNEGYAWQQLATDVGDGRRKWAFQQDKYIEKFLSAEVRALGEDWPKHPAFAGTLLGEGIARIKRETYAFLAELGYVYDEEAGMYRTEGGNDERVALFAHQGFGLAFLSCVMGIPYPEFCTHFDMTHSGMTVIEFSPKPGLTAPRILQLSNDSHIYADGLPTNYNNELRF